LLKIVIYSYSFGLSISASAPITAMNILAATLLACAHASDDVSLMQNLVTRSSAQSQLAVYNDATSSKQARKDNNERLLEAATKMMKNGVTPDVVTFIEDTNREIEDEVLVSIQDEHDKDQQYINTMLAHFGTCIAALESETSELAVLQDAVEAKHQEHQMCRSGEALLCAQSRRCETQLIHDWNHVRTVEERMREIHEHIHEEWCVTPPGYPSIDSCTGCTDPNLCGVTLENHVLTRCFDWADMSPYPILDSPLDVSEWRRFSVTEFGHYIEQKRIVEEAWNFYNLKLTECSGIEISLDAAVPICDNLQSEVNSQTCTLATDSKTDRTAFGQCWDHAWENYNAVARVGTSPTELPCDRQAQADTHGMITHHSNESVCDWGTIRQLEYDRKREWETLKIVQCLLNHVHSSVETSIETGAPCPTIDSDPDGTRMAIEDCHVVTESLTTHLTIIYGDPPPVPPQPPVIEPPCSPEYFAQEQSFITAVVTHYTSSLTDDDAYPQDTLTSYFTQLSIDDWPGCAAPIVCQKCEAFAAVAANPDRTEPSRPCEEHNEYLSLGANNVDTFRCGGSWCLSMTGRCNGHSQCGDGSDEEGCFSLATTPELSTPAYLGVAYECPAVPHTNVHFQCASAEQQQTSSCVEKVGLCNGIHNCADGSDEASCDGFVHIPDDTHSQESAYLGCFVDDGNRHFGNMVGSTGDAATNTYDGCRAACSGYAFMSLQYGGECFCSNESPSGAAPYFQRDDSECNRMVEPCSLHSFNCGGTWRNAIYSTGQAVSTDENQCLATYQAETATLVGAIVHANTASAGHAGFTGSSFVDYLNANGDYVEWSLPSCSGGAATASFRYALAGGNRPLRVLVNGVEVTSSLSFPATGGWASWGEASVEVHLNAGQNLVRLVAAGSSGANMDALIITSPVAADFLQISSHSNVASRNTPVRRVTSMRSQVRAVSTSGRTISVQSATSSSHVYHDRSYSFTSMGDFEGSMMVRYSNDDKATDFGHVMTQITIDEPMIVFIVKVTDRTLPWLATEGYSLTGRSGVQFSGARSTSHTEWSGVLSVDVFDASEVYSRTFNAGRISVPGNDGGDGGFLMFLEPAGFPAWSLN